MGSYLEINDTLQLTIEQGFPSNLLDLTKHTQNPISLDQTGQWLNNEWQTSGTYKIIDLYDPEYQREFTRREAPKGKSYF
jgi:hypothetical protein